MKKIILIVISLSCVGFTSYAQWDGATNFNGDTYRSGKVGIGIFSTNYLPTTLLDVNGGFTHMTFNSSATSPPAIPPSDPWGGLTVGWNRIGNSGAEVNLYNVYDNAPRSFVFSQKTGGTSLTDLVTFEGTGNVGIGTTQPQKLLHLLKAGDATLRMEAVGNQGRRWDILSSGGAGVVNSGHFGIVDVTNNVERIDIDMTGNVGIGTGLPTTLLDVFGGWTHMVHNSQTLPPSNPYGGLTIGWNRIGSSNAEVDFNNVYDNAPTSFLFSQKTGANSAADLFAIKSNGHVGIGLVNPGKTLHLFEIGDAAIRIQNEYYIGGTQNKAWDLVTSAGQGLVISGHFGIVDVNNNVQRLGIDGNTGMVYIGPRIGYGNAHTNALFTVNGKGVFQEVVVTSNWADFVFNEDYTLMPLQELENYYKEKHHLPNVPSAREISENGNDLGKTDVILLQKIEELTLYIVNQQKEIDLLKEEINRK